MSSLLMRLFNHHVYIYFAEWINVLLRISLKGLGGKSYVNVT